MTAIVRWPTSSAACAAERAAPDRRRPLRRPCRHVRLRRPGARSAGLAHEVDVGDRRHRAKPGADPLAWLTPEKRKRPEPKPAAPSSVGPAAAGAVQVVFSASKPALTMAFTAPNKSARCRSSGRTRVPSGGRSMPSTAGGCGLKVVNRPRPGSALRPRRGPRMPTIREHWQCAARARRRISGGAGSGALPCCRLQSASPQDLRRRRRKLPDERAALHSNQEADRAAGSFTRPQGPLPCCARAPA